MRQVVRPTEGRYHVYFFLTEGGQYVKIGVADDVDRRLKEVQTGCPFPLHIKTKIGCVSREQAFVIEQEIHKTIKKLNGKAWCHGEWFKWSLAGPMLKRLMNDFDKTAKPKDFFVEYRRSAGLSG